MNLIEHATHCQNTLDQLTERINTLAAEHAKAMLAKDTEIGGLRSKVAALETLKETMETQVAKTLASGDPKQYEELAKSFLEPAEQKARAEKLARIESLKAEAAQLEAELK